MTIKGRAAIISTGPEITQAWKRDSNSEFLLRELNKLNFNVLCRACCDDDRHELTALISHLQAQMDLVVITGGLGCTDDDLTLSSAGQAMGRELVFDARQWEVVREKLVNRCSAVHKGFAYKIEGSRLFNGLPGVAAGHFLETPECTFIILPGPPDEVHDRFASMLTFFKKHLCSARELSPFFRIISTGKVPVPVRLRFYNISESGLVNLMKTIKDFLHSRDLEFAGTFLGNRRYVEGLFLKSNNDVNPDMNFFETNLCQAIEECLAALDVSELQSKKGFYENPKKVLVTQNKEPWFLVAQRIEELSEKKPCRSGETRGEHFSLGFAESLTGGALSSGFVDIPGISKWLLGSVVAYHNDVKSSVLNVDNQILEEHGAVSSQCSRAMAVGASRILKSSITVSCTGIAGPGGGSERKPVGLVYLTCVNTKVPSEDGGPFELTEKRVFRGSRTQIRYQTADLACFMILKSLGDL